MDRSNQAANIAALKIEFHKELLSIADWWSVHAVDHTYGGFHGEVDARNNAVSNANKGIILNARILWFFSETALHTTGEANNTRYRECATRAYEYIIQHFLDTEYGGMYWEMDVNGRPVNTRKQVYAQAFTIYALSAYFKLNHDREALDHALQLFKLLESRAIDDRDQGYLEAFARDWSPVDDWRLSNIDLNYPKSQNTHLHVLEAYTALHDVYPVTEVKAALRYSIQMFDRFMINRDNHHLRMFMDMQWKDFSPGYTYGHDIEAAWLIARALESLGDAEYTGKLIPTLLKVVEVTTKEALADNGQLWNAYDFETKSIDKSSMWWVQAEALVGFLFAYVKTHDGRYFVAAEGIWQFIKQHQIDHVNGEWFWLADNGKTEGKEHYKVGFWKCPYHNGRAMMEAVRYLEKA
ncbi:MAG TPA: AGE family epimerase/isomerase [Steroidobacteraceae bacterium]|nr:AGE family epimerase/isomerase [Steroidobacteraceae bacterium]